jgi:hypothetical protein
VISFLFFFVFCFNLLHFFCPNFFYLCSDLYFWFLLILRLVCSHFSSYLSCISGLFMWNVSVFMMWVFTAVKFL